MMKTGRTPASLKAALLGVCALAAFAAGSAYYARALEDMTPWQRAQKIDFDRQSGSTKFKALIDASTAGAAVFCSGALAGAAAYKIYKYKRGRQ